MNKKLLISFSALAGIALSPAFVVSCKSETKARTTLASNFEIKLEMRDKYATPYKSWDTLNSGLKTEDEITKANEEFLKNKLNAVSSSIFSNKPSDAKIKDVKIRKDFTIGSIKNGYDSAHGAVYIAVTLDKYYDKTGKLIENGNDKFYFKVTGFKVDENLGTYLDYGSLYDDRKNNAITLKNDNIKTFTALEATNSETNKQTVKDSIIDALFGVSQTNPTKYTLNKIKNKVYGDELWQQTSLDKAAVSKYFDIDWKNNPIVANDTLGTLELEVTFKDIWWKNGVFQEEYKTKVRFSGFKVAYTKPTYNPNLLVVKQNNEDVAIVTRKDFETIDFLGHLLTGFIWNKSQLPTPKPEEEPKTGETGGTNNTNISIDKILKTGIYDLLKGQDFSKIFVAIQKALNDGKNDGEEVKPFPPFTLEDENALKKVLEASIQYSMQKNNNDDNLFGLKRNDYIVGINDSSTLKVSNIQWNDNGDWFSFSLKIDDQPKEFKFKFLGFLGDNNYNSENLTGNGELNSNNNSNYKNYFDFKWVRHSYSEGTQNPQFNSSHYWYSLELTIKNNSTDTNWNTKFKLIRPTSMFSLFFNDIKVVPYDVILSSTQVTLSFKHESWNSLSNWNQNTPNIFLSIEGLGSFDFNKIFKNDESKMLNYNLNGLIFAAAYTEDTDQYGYINIKGNNLLLENPANEYIFYTSPDKTATPITFSDIQIVDILKDDKTKNVFFKLRVPLNETNKKIFNDNKNLYVQLKDSNVKHLINIRQ